jgi:hypothetical protein
VAPALPALPASCDKQGKGMSVRVKKGFLAEADPARSTSEIAKTLYKIPALLTMWTRCGKPNCRCNRGQLHGPYYVLHWREGDVQRRRYVRRADVAAVRAVIASRRHQERAARRAADEAHRDLRRMRAWLKDLEAGRWP